MKTVEEIKREIERIETSRKSAIREVNRGTRRLMELDMELLKVLETRSKEKAPAEMELQQGASEKSTTKE